MSEGERISTLAGLDGHLEEMRRVGGDPGAFEAAVRSLASSLDKPLGWRALLKLAQVGSESYPAFPMVPSRDSQIFAGRPAAELPALRPTTRTDCPRREPLTGESTADYGRYLAAHVVDWLSSQEAEVTEDELSVATAYVALLARQDFRQVVGWKRSLDAHSVMMLTTERGFRRVGGLELAAPVEEAFFRWLHLASYDEVAPEHLREVAARRAIRRQHEERPTGEVAVMVCETQLVDPFPFDALSDHLRSGPLLTEEQIRGSFLELAQRGDEKAEEWAARARGFEDRDELDLTPRAVIAELVLESYAGGHLLRWMVDRDVPIDPIRLGGWGFYAGAVADTMVFGPARNGMEKIPATVAHTVSLKQMHRRRGPIPLTEELFLLAWLLAQNRFAINLAAWLEQRDRRLADLADGGS